jgi:hypothetical protein
MRPPQISVLTATDLRVERGAYLLELYSDLCAAQATWQWVLCIDGDHGRYLPEVLKRDPRVTSMRAGRQVGAAAARNLALGLADGYWVTSADDDDRLPRGSLDVRLAAAAKHRVGWVGGLLADLHDDELVTWDCPAPRGRLAAGDLWRAWRAAEAAFPLGPTTLLVRTELMRRVGGWQGLPQGEDFGMVMAVSGATGGWMLDEVVYHYRKHAGQMMTAPEFPDLERAVRRITFERGRLLAHSRAS